MAKYRAAIVGCGGRSSDHVRAYQDIPEACVVACCDIDAGRRQAVAEKFDIRPYVDAGEMIRAESPHVVHLITWPSMRVELMSLVAELGVPACVVEKPIATGVADWWALRELERAGGTRFAVNHQLRWHPVLARCRWAIASGRVGDVKFVDCSAGMNISGQGTHVLSYGMFLNGDSPVVRVWGTVSGGSQMADVHPGPDHTVGYLTFANGVRGLWNTGATAPRCNDSGVIWQHVRAGAYAEAGRVCFEEFGRWEIISPEGRQAGEFGGMAAWEADNLTAQMGLHRAMIDWLADESNAPKTNLRRSLEEWKVVLALYASAVERRPIEMADFDPPEDLWQQLCEALACGE